VTVNTDGVGSLLLAESVTVRLTINDPGVVYLTFIGPLPVVEEAVPPSKTHA
jgi:hypothetical protein